MNYSDLLSVPYREFGRGMDGMDCYGLVLELCRRNGTPLRDIVYDSVKQPESFASNNLCRINVEETSGPEKGGIITCTFQNELHTGFLLDRNTVMHQTFEGVRITPLLALHNIKYYRVTQCQLQ